MVTKDMLERERDQRVELRPELHYTPGGTVEADVNEQIRISLENSIRFQEERLKYALEQMRRERAQTFTQGFAKAQFEVQQEKEITP